MDELDRELLAHLSRWVLVPVIEIPDPALAVPLVDALTEGGLPCAEITLRTEGAMEAIREIVRRRPQVTVGAGTVLETRQLDEALDIGAQFVVTPGFNSCVVERALQRKAAVLPGICTATEIEMSRALGLDTVKFFPAEAAGGAPYLKALVGPYRSIRFVPTGGIDAKTLGSYLKIGQVIAVGGSWMAPRRLIEARDFAAITERTREAVDLAGRLRPETATPAPSDEALVEERR